MSADSTANFAHYEGQNPVPGRGENIITIPSKITRANGGDATLVAPPSPSTAGMKPQADICQTITFSDSPLTDEPEGIRESYSQDRTFHSFQQTNELLSRLILQQKRLLDNLNSQQRIRNKEFDPEACPQNSAEERIYESLTGQFNVLVMISTFTAGLIIGFLAVTQTVQSTRNLEHDTPAQVAILFSLFGMAIHFGNILVAGRGSSLTAQQSILPTNDIPSDARYWKVYLRMCEHLHLIGTVSFLISLVIVCFMIFSQVWYPFIFIVASLSITAAVYARFYWRASWMKAHIHSAKKGLQKRREKPNPPSIVTSPHTLVPIVQQRSS